MVELCFIDLKCSLHKGGCHRFLSPLHSLPRLKSYLYGIGPWNSFLLPQLSHDHIAKDLCAVIVIFVAVFHETKSVDITDVSLAVGAQEVEAAHVLKEGYLARVMYGCLLNGGGGCGGLLLLVRASDSRSE